MNTRQLKNSIFKNSSRIASFLVFTVFLFILSNIFLKGISAVSFNFIFKSSSNFGASGGIFYQLIGSVLMLFFASVLCVPISLGTAIFKSEFIRNKRIQLFSDLLIYGLNGIPSIVYGIFGIIFFVNVLNTGISWFVGSVILAIMMTPTVTLTSYSSLVGIPKSYKENALALGLTRWQMIKTVLIPQGISGTITGLFLAIARALGETAPIMFIATAFSGVEFPGSFLEPIATLPTHILTLAQNAGNPDALKNAWGTSLVLVLLVGISSSVALIIRLKYSVKNQD